MKNRFTVTIEFSYKGENFEFKAGIDLDECMERLNAIPDLHDLIAKQHGIDAYSYQYEVLTSEELQFSAVEGFAGEFIHEGNFDAQGFAARWREERVGTIAAEIARRVMGVADLATQPALKQALLEAYRAGQSSARAE